MVFQGNGRLYRNLLVNLLCGGTPDRLCNYHAGYRGMNIYRIYWFGLACCEYDRIESLFQEKFYLLGVDSGVCFGVVIEK